MDGYAVGDLESKQFNVIAEVKAGDQFASGNTFTIRPNHPEDYLALLDALEENGLPDRILYLWCLGDDEIDNRGFYSQLYLAQALWQRKTLDEQTRTLLLDIQKNTNDFPDAL